MENIDIINFIYTNVDLSKFRFKLLENEDDLKLLGENFQVSPNFSGLNCLMVFLKIKKNKYSVLIDRKTLNYKRALVKIENVHIIPFNLELDDSIYNGSIFDGTYITQQNRKVFIITDVYYFRGENIENDKLSNKLININAYFNSNYSVLEKKNELEIMTNKIDPIVKAEKLIKELIPKIKTLPIRGIVFYPEISGTKLIYLFNSELKFNRFEKNDKTKFNEIKHIEINNEIKHNEIKHDEIKYDEIKHDEIKHKEINNDKIEHIKEEKKKVRYISKTDDEIIITFEMRKTSMPDVYNLYLIDDKNELKKKILKKIDIAYIPTKQCSFMCRELIKQNILERLLMKCKFDTEKEKWIPVEKNNINKIPSTINEIEDKMEVIEEIEE